MRIKDNSKDKYELLSENPTPIIKIIMYIVFKATNIKEKESQVISDSTSVISPNGTNC